MRLDFVYAIGSLWGSSAHPQICSPETYSPPALSRTAAWAAPRPYGQVTAFINVNVIPMDTERVLADQTVIVEGDRVVALGPSRKVEVPVGAIRIDGRGKYLIPGLSDMHVHGHPRNIAGNTYDEVVTRLTPYITEGVASVRYFSVADDSLTQWFKRAEAVGGPHVYAPAFAISNHDMVERASGFSKAVAARNATAANAAGYRFVYIHGSIVDAPGAGPRPAVRALLATAPRHGLVVTAHDHGPSFGKALVLGSAGGSIEHLAWFRDTLIGFAWQQFGPIGQREADLAFAKIPPLANAVARSGLWVTPTLHCIVNSYHPPPLQKTIMQRAITAFQEAGVGMLLAGDDGYSVHDELAALVDAGLTPYQALVTGTRNVAQYLGLLDSSGTIAVGKRADLVLLYGNPLQDIGVVREPAGVMAHGQWLDRRELDRRLLAYHDPHNPMLRSWFTLGVRAGALIPPNPHQDDTTQAAVTAAQNSYREPFRKLRAQVLRIEALVDSLTAARSAEANEEIIVQRLRRRVADELGAMRTMLPLEKHEAFDPVARLWLREQARQGFPMVVPGVIPLP